MRFRPCIDLHDGRVKQIVGATLDGQGKTLVTNFVTDLSPAHFATMYRHDDLLGGHVIMLGPGNEAAAVEALRAFPGGLQIGGGIHPGNAGTFLDAGASHVIVTSYVFRQGIVDRERLAAIVKAVGRSRLVLDLSCRKQGGRYLVTTDRWQRFTSTPVDAALLADLGSSCAEFLVHAVDVEGKQQGVDEYLVALLAQGAPMAVTYAGGVHSLDDLNRVRISGNGCVDVTVGSALDIFGGSLAYRSVVEWHRRAQCS